MGLLGTVNWVMDRLQTMCSVSCKKTLGTIGGQFGRHLLLVGWGKGALASLPTAGGLCTVGLLTACGWVAVG